MDYTIEVVRDCCCVLETFLDQDGSLSLARITKDTGLSKNKVFRILATLEECRLVDRTSAGEYRLHVHFLDFGRQVIKDLDVAKVSAPVLEWLVEETGESAFVSIIDDDEALCVVARESPQQIRLSAQVGRRLPLYAGATPTILLAFLAAEERNALLSRIELKPLTPHTITDRNELAKYLEQIRVQGYVVTPEDLDLGARGVAAPIRDHQGQVVASISIAGVASRFTEERIGHYTQLIIEGAGRISQKIGYKYALSVSAP
jgi:IclR family KDG regulon transcriptional repressor